MRFVKYVNVNGYSQMALTGQDFCKSALHGQLLILKHTDTFLFTSGIGTMYNLLGKLTICVINGTVSYFLLQNLNAGFLNLYSYLNPIYIVFLLTATIA